MAWLPVGRGQHEHRKRLAMRCRIQPTGSESIPQGDATLFLPILPTPRMVLRESLGLRSPRSLGTKPALQLALKGLSRVLGAITATRLLTQ